MPDLGAVPWAAAWGIVVVTAKGSGVEGISQHLGDCVQIQSTPDPGAVARAAVWGIVVVTAKGSGVEGAVY